MPPTEPEVDELFRFKEIAFDVAQIYGVTSAQGLTRAKRALNRAMIYIVGNDRRWNWRRTKDSFYTISGTREYSLQRDVRADISNLWMEGAPRGRIGRIPTGQFLSGIPDPTNYSGNPYLFDYEGVDSSGAPVFSLFPTPSSRIQVFYRYTRLIKPISDDDKDVRASWGMPDNLLEALTQKAAALCLQGVNGERYKEVDDLAEALIADAYAADQSRPNTTHRAPMQDEQGVFHDEVMLPPEFGPGP